MNIVLDTIAIKAVCENVSNMSLFKQIFSQQLVEMSLHYNQQGCVCPGAKGRALTQSYKVDSANTERKDSLVDRQFRFISTHCYRLSSLFDTRFRWHVLCCPVFLFPWSWVTSCGPRKVIRGSRVANVCPAALLWHTRGFLKTSDPINPQSKTSHSTTRKSPSPYHGHQSWLPEADLRAGPEWGGAEEAWRDCKALLVPGELQTTILWEMIQSNTM